MVKRIGSNKSSIVLRARTPERAAELLDLCRSRGLRAIVGIEPDREEDISDLSRSLSTTADPFSIRFEPTRNAPCPCGSGRKYKNCCAPS